MNSLNVKEWQKNNIVTRLNSRRPQTDPKLPAAKSHSQHFTKTTTNKTSKSRYVSSRLFKATFIFPYHDSLLVPRVDFNLWFK